MTTKNIQLTKVTNTNMRYISDVYDIYLSSLFPASEYKNDDSFDYDLYDITIGEIIDDVIDDGKYYVRNHLKPLIKAIGGAKKFNEGLALIDLKFVASDLAFYITSDVKINQKIIVIENLFNDGLISELEKLSIDNLAFLDVGRDLLVMLKSEYGMKTLADFYLLKSGDNTCEELFDINNEHAKMVYQEKELLIESDVFVGIRAAQKSDISSIKKYKWW